MTVDPQDGRADRSSSSASGDRRRPDAARDNRPRTTGGEPGDRRTGDRSESRGGRNDRANRGPRADDRDRAPRRDDRGRPADGPRTGNRDDRGARPDSARGGDRSRTPARGTGGSQGRPWRDDRGGDDRRPDQRQDRPRTDAPRGDRPRTDGPRSDRPRSDRPRTDAQRSTGARADGPRADGPRSDRPRSEGRTDRPRTDGPRSDRPRSDSSGGRDAARAPREDRRPDDRRTDDRRPAAPRNPKRAGRNDRDDRRQNTGDGGPRTRGRDTAPAGGRSGGPGGSGGRPTGRSDDRRPRPEHERGGQGRDRRSAEDRPITRHTQLLPKPTEPPLPDEVTPDLLDFEVRRDLRGLPKDLADSVARHLVAAGELLDDDPEAALAHARFARHRASRIAVVREACGLAAYHAGDWAEALSELRASRRMGGAAHVPVMADAERALGRPERALEIARSPESADLPRDEAMELLIVTSGARRDLGEASAAVVGLQVPELDVRRADDPWTCRLFYAYGEALVAAGRRDDAVRAFLDAAQTDAEGVTDAEERAALVAAGIDTPPGDLELDVADDVAEDEAAPGETAPDAPAEAATDEDEADEVVADDEAVAVGGDLVADDEPADAPEDAAADDPVSDDEALAPDETPEDATGDTGDRVPAGDR